MFLSLSYDDHNSVSEFAQPISWHAPLPRVKIGNLIASAPRTENQCEPDLLAAIEAMKPLVAGLGSEKVKRIADLLG
jgi:hypothetical protein